MMLTPRTRRRLPALLLLPALLTFVFWLLVADPSALIVDADRPGVDRATPADGRAVGNDLTRLFLPHHGRIASALAHIGRLPGWDPAGFGGRPLVGNPQAGLWYPPTWIAWRWWQPSALGWLTLGHIAFGGIGTYTLARSFQLRPLASVIASVCFSINPYVLAQLFEGHYPHLWSASWFPWAFWAAIGLRSGRLRGGFLPPILAMAFLTGHPQEAYYLGLALGIWLLAVMGRHLSAGQSRPVAFAAAVGMGVAALTSALIAVELVPDALAQPYGLRGAKHPAMEAAKYHVHPVNLVQLLGPRALGGPADYEGPDNSWESLLAVGWVPLILGSIAVARSRRRADVRGWLALVLLTTLFAFGRNFGVFNVLYALAPGMGRFRVPSRALFLAALGASMLAGYGVEAVARSRALPFRLLAATLAILIAALALAVWSVPALETHDPWQHPPDGVVWLRAGARLARDPVFLSAFIGSSAALIWLRLRPWDRRAVAVVLGLMASGELALYGHDLIRVAPASRFLDPDPVGEAIARARPSVPSPFRIRARDAFYGDARAFAAGLEKTNLNDSFQVQHAADLYERLYPMFGTVGPPAIARRYRDEVQAAVLERMNVALLVSDRNDSRFGWPVAASGTWDGVPYSIRRNPDPLPRAYVVPRAEVMPDGPAMIERFPEVPAREAVLMERDPLPGPGPREPFSPASYTATDPDRVVIDVTTSAPGLLVVADTWMPGWSARLDDRPAAILRGNRAQRVVVLDRPGSHRVVMTYTPPGLEIGKAITAGAMAVWGVIFLVSARRTLTQRGRRSGSRPGHTGARNHSGPGPSPRRGCSGAGGRRGA